MSKEDRAEEFGVTDHSATAPILKRLVSDRVIRVLPGFYSPNALTLTGGFLATASCLIIWTYMGEMRTGSDQGKFWMMSSAILLIAYAVFDQLDGMQARKLGRSSPFGDFLDHWVDTIIANSMTVPIMVMLEIDQLLIWLMAFVTSLAFWAHNWETRNINYRHLPFVGGLESIWTALLIMTLTSIFGIEVWRETVFGVSLLSIFYWLGLSALVWVVIKSLMKSRVRVSEYVGFISALIPISAWLLLFAPGYRGDLLYIWLGYVAMGFMATYLTGNLMRHLWLGGEYLKFDLLTHLLGAAVLIAAIPQFGSDSPSGVERLVVVSVCGLAICRVIYQGVSSYRQMMKG